MSGCVCKFCSQVFCCCQVRNGICNSCAVKEEEKRKAQIVKKPDEPK